MPSPAYTPYDGSKKPFSIGLEPLDPANWTEPDGHLVEHLAQKAQILADEPERTALAEPDTIDAQAEVLSLLLDYLPAHHAGTYTRSGDAITVIPAGQTYRVAEWRDRPLELAARLVQEDLCLMRASDRGYRLVAAVLCFPSSWSLIEKFSLPMADIHAKVPGYGERMGARVNRIFDNLRVDQPVWRMNWSIYDDALLRHAEAKQKRARFWVDSGVSPGEAFVRVERQTLRRLARTGDILFTIKIYVDPLNMLPRHPQGPALAAGLRDQLAGLNAGELAYKDLARAREPLIAYLDAIATG